jgi:opacity protein-like surface antigen
MRALSCLAVLAVALVGATSAQAADLVGQPGAEYASFAQHALPVAIYDYEPGVYVRAYWSSPWRHRRYFPFTGKAPILGRDEDLSDAGLPPQTETFYREWSTSRLTNEALQAAPPAQRGSIRFRRSRNNVKL